MAGYFDFSKSNNAVAAELVGKYPLTEAARVVAKDHGVTINHAKQWLASVGHSEWHHTSSYYTLTYYYNTELDWDEIEELLAYRPSIKKTPNSVNLFGKVVYKEWAGTRKHPYCLETVHVGIYEVKGDWIIMHRPNGSCFRKKYTNVISKEAYKVPLAA